MRYNHFDMLPERAFLKVGGRITLEGGGGGQSGPTTSTTQTSNIPEYARPYVETMLGAAQQQVYNMDSSGNVTGIKGYTPYSQNAADYVAPFSPLQTQAQTGAANLQTPGQFGTGTDLATQAGYGSLGLAGQAGGLQGQSLGYGQAGSMYGQAGQAYGAAGAQQANMAAQRAAQQAQMYGAQGAMTGRQALGYGAMGAGYGGAAAGQAGQGYGAQAAYQAQATSPEATSAYMSPYMQNVVDVQKQAAARDYQIAQQARKAQAVGAGAFGGSRQAIAEAESQRALMSQLQNIQATGSQQAYQQAQAAQQFGANLGIQGLQAGTAAQQAGIQGAQAGLAGVQGAQSGYGMGLQGVGQQLAAGQLGLQGTAQGIQGAQAGMQGAGVGLSGVAGATQAGQYGLQGYGQAGTAAGQLGNLGTSQLAAQTSVLGTQNQFGSQQQQQQQNIINQAIQNYAMQQQYPQQQLGFLSSLIHGLPLQATQTQGYQAAPSTTSQLAGLGTAGLAAYGLSGGFKKKGGVIKERKPKADGIDMLALYDTMKGAK